MLVYWKGSYVRGNDTVWCAVPLCLLWMVWNKRNCRAFKGMERPSMELKLVFPACFMSGWLCYLPF